MNLTHTIVGALAGIKKRLFRRRRDYYVGIPATVVFFSCNMYLNTMLATMYPMIRAAYKMYGVNLP